MLFVTLKKHQGRCHAYFVFFCQITRKTPGANYPVAETLINNVPNVPQERLNLNSNWTFFTRLAAGTAAPIFWTGSVDVEGLCPSSTFILQRSNCQTPFTIHAHVLQPSHYHHTLSPAHDKFQKVEIFFP